MRWIGHAGLARHRPAGAPDRESLGRAVELRLDMLELDVARSGDGALVLLHDLQLPGGDRVDALPLGELRARIAGLLTLDEAIEQVQGRFPLLLDLKGGGSAEPLGRWLAGRADAPSMTVCTDDLGALLRLRHLAPRAPRWRTLPAVRSGDRGERRRRAAAVARRASLPARVGLLAREVAAVAVSVDRHALTAALCARAHGCGLEVAVWTVNRERTARLAQRRGADWITSDAVEELRRTMMT